MVEHQYSSDLMNCIRECRECSQVCHETIVHCLYEGGEHSDPDHILLLKECALICDTAALLMTTFSSFHQTQCGLCADSCIACAESCESLPGKKMEECAKICRSCAQSCENMSEMIDDDSIDDSDEDELDRKEGEI